MQSMYRDVKAYCRQRNYELQMLDLHWGVKDWVTDDHSAPDKALKLLETCVEGARNLAFVVRHENTGHICDRVHPGESSEFSNEFT